MTNESTGPGSAHRADPAKDSEAAWDRYINEGVPDASPDSPAESKTPPDEPPPPDPEEDPGFLVAGEGANDDDIIDPVQLKLEEIQEGMDRLLRDFDLKIKNDVQKNKIIDGLHQELQAYKNDIVKSHLRSLVMDVIQFIDNTRKLTQHYSTQSAEEVDPTKLLNLLDGIPSELEDLLSRQGVTPFTCEVREFDPGRQRALKRVPTPRPEMDKTVAETLHPGYQWDGQVIRPEMVTVHVFQPAPAEPEPQEGSSDE